MICSSWGCWVSEAGGGAILVGLVTFDEDVNVCRRRVDGRLKIGEKRIAGINEGGQGEQDV